MSDMKVGIAYPAFFASFKHYIPQLELVKNFDKVKEFDLMIFSGGEDISPSYYNQYPEGAVGVNPQRDAWEKRIFDRCQNYDIPMFGVCRGHQFICALMGGVLLQDIGRQRGYYHPHEHKIVYHFDHKIKEFFPEIVNSMHHQAIYRMPNYLKSIASYRDDSEITVGKRILTVQFHPEFMYDTQPFFTWLVDEWAKGLKKPCLEDEVKKPGRKPAPVTEEDVRVAALAFSGAEDFFTR